MDDIQVRDNLTIETVPVRIEGREMKKLRGKEIALVKVVWDGAAGESATWELESKMRESYPMLFESDNFRGRTYSKWGRVVTPRICLELFSIIYDLML